MKRFACVLRTGVLPLVVLGVLGTLLLGIGLRAAPAAHAAPPPHANRPPHTGPPPMAMVNVNPNATVETGEDVTILAGRLTWRCTPAPSGDIEGHFTLTITQGTTTISTSGSITCDGSGHNVQVFIPLASEGDGFSPGPAHLVLTITTPDGSASATADTTIRIRG